MPTDRRSKGAIVGRLSKCVVIGAASVALVIAGCSSTKKAVPTTTAAAEPATRTTRGITDNSVKIGGVIDDAQFLQAGNGAGARFLRANNEGGVNGRTIDYVGVTSDKTDANTNAEIVQRLVDQDQVAVVAPVISSRFGGAAFLNKTKTPFVGWGISRDWCGSDYGFGITGCLTNPNPTEENGAWGVVLQKYFANDANKNPKTVAVVGVDDDSSKIGTKAVAASVKAAGFTVLGPFNSIPVAVPATDYTQFAQEVLTANANREPDVTLQIMPFKDVNGLTKKMNELGYKGLYESAVGYDPALLQVPTFQKNFLIALQWAPYESSAAAIKQMKEDFAAYDAKNGTKTPLNLANAASYWAADLLLAGLQKAGRDLTIEKLVAAMNNNFSYSVPDALGTVEFPKNHTVPVPCQSAVQISNGAYQPVVPFTCTKLVSVS
ncbi:MAG: ABC transporter substrate-binding protein [Acidimicrobiia bacterium]